MPEVIDLSTPIQPDHFRGHPKQHLHRRHREGHSQVTWLSPSVHAFTFMDAARHLDPAGSITDAVPLDATIGRVAVANVRASGANAPIIGALIAATGTHVQLGDLVLVRAGWDRVERIDRPALWANPPRMTPEAADWLHMRPPKVAGPGFPCDYCIRNAIAGLLDAPAEDYATHQRLLLRGVILTEYLTNLLALPAPRTFVVCAPLSLISSDGAPARVVALEGFGG
jgi:kynurenine formamidase